MSTILVTTSADPAMQQLWAREMREERRKQVAQEAAAVAGEGETLRQRLAAARLAKEAKEKIKEKIKEKVVTPIRTGTSWALKAAWLNLIDSFGLTLIYINMHVFLRWVFPDAFCKLGEEWVPKQVAPKSAKNIAGTAFGIVEVMGLLLLDLLAFFLIISFLSLIVMMVGWLDQSFFGKVWSMVKGVVTAIYSLGWVAVQALVDLF